MIYIIPDIHGYLYEFEAMLDKVSFGNEDELYLLGDYIDRGYDSRGVVDRIMELMDQGYKIVPLRGNHEQMLLDSSDRLEELAFMGNKRKIPFLGDDGKVEHKYLVFFESLAIYLERNDFILAHAGVNFRKEKPFEDTFSMMWMRRMRYVPEFLNKLIIHGHTPTAISEIRANIETDSQVIPLDNGVFMSKEGYGSLLCLEFGGRNLYEIKAKHRKMFY